VVGHYVRRDLMHFSESGTLHAQAFYVAHHFFGHLAVYMYQYHDYIP